MSLTVAGMSLGPALIGAVAAPLVGGLFAGDAASAPQQQYNTANDQGSAVAGQQMALANNQDARAEEQWQRYKQTYAPAEDQMLEEAKGVGSVANQNKAAGDAAAGVSASFANARDQLAKNPGVNPSSQQYQQQAGQIALAEAASSASAQTGAREAVKDRATAQLTNAVSLGKGLPASANSFATAGSAAAGSAGGLYGTLATNARQGVQDAYSAGGSFGKAVGGVMNSKGVQDWMNGPSLKPSNNVGLSPAADTTNYGTGYGFDSVN